MVLRDTFLYIAEDNRLQIVNVARPRSPTVVGTCNLPGDAVCLFVKDSFAYVGSWPSQIISVRQPTQPTVIGSFDMPLGGIVVEDTFAYVARTYDSMYVYSVARPTQPLRLGSLCMSGGIPYGQWNRGLAKVDTIVYIGGWQMKVVSVADPARPFEVDARWAPPSLAVQRIEYVPPFLYVACGDGGVSVLETLQTGIVEQPSERGAASVVVEPTVTSGCVRVTSRGLVGVLRIGVYNVAGELVELATCYGGMGSMDLSFAPAGAYVVRAETRTGCYTARVVKVRRR